VDRVRHEDKRGKHAMVPQQARKPVAGKEQNSSLQMFMSLFGVMFFVQDFAGRTIIFSGLAAKAY